ncbi:MAG: tRNA epoxyqueuosine(34) reductase QueG [candidate division KSB1 bacterium]|nr:tRNA epoxyqueuosine(34) reductase QueG [candidate division KSB1 bacterium]
MTMTGSMDNSSGLSEKIKSFARSLGFCAVGIARAERLDGSSLDEWLRRGYHGEMAWMAVRRELRLDPAALLPNAKSVIVCAMNYFTNRRPATPTEGCISLYALGDDYHHVLKNLLRRLLDFIRAENPGVSGRICVDSAPIMEKAWAVRAGIGRRGKHSLLISPQCGSWIFLGELIVDIELDADASMENDPCGYCTACIEACPTGAIVEPYVIDARRCISFLTVELKADRAHPPELAAKIGNRLYGCDACQVVCPWNHRLAKETSEPAFRPRPELLHPNLEAWLKMRKEEFDLLFRNNPIRRIGLEALRRNILTVLNNRSKMLLNGNAEN